MQVQSETLALLLQKFVSIGSMLAKDKESLLGICLITLTQFIVHH